MRKNEMYMSFLADSVNESLARITVAAFAMELNPTMEEIEDIRTSVSEAVTNAVVHAYGDRIGPIRMKFEQLGNNAVRITVRDYGVGIADVKKAMEPCYTTGQDDRAGMGFTVMQSFSDSLRVRSRPGKGTSVVFVKRLSVKHER